MTAEAFFPDAQSHHNTRSVTATSMISLISVPIIWGGQMPPAFSESESRSATYPPSTRIAPPGIMGPATSIADGHPPRLDDQTQHDPRDEDRFHPPPDARHRAVVRRRAVGLQFVRVDRFADDDAREEGEEVGECCHFAGGEGRHFLLLLRQADKKEFVSVVYFPTRYSTLKTIISISQAPFFAFILYIPTHSLFISRDAGSELHGLKKYGKHRADEIIIGL